MIRAGRLSSVDVSLRWLVEPRWFTQVDLAGVVGEAPEVYSGGPGWGLPRQVSLSLAVFLNLKCKSWSRVAVVMRPPRHVEPVWP